MSKNLMESCLLVDTEENLKLIKDEIKEAYASSDIVTVSFEKLAEKSENVEQLIFKVYNFGRYVYSKELLKLK